MEQCPNIEGHEGAERMRCAGRSGASRSPTTLRLHPFETVGNYGSKQRIALSSKMKLETSEYFSLERCHISLREDSPEPFHCTLSPMSPSIDRGQMCAHRRYCAAVVKDISRKIPTSRVCQSDKSDSFFTTITLSYSTKD